MTAKFYLDDNDVCHLLLADRDLEFSQEEWYAVAQIVDAQIANAAELFTDQDPA